MGGVPGRAGEGKRIGALGHELSLLLWSRRRKSQEIRVIFFLFLAPPRGD